MGSIASTAGTGEQTADVGAWW